LSLQPGVTFIGGNWIDQSNDSRGGAVAGARSDQTNITWDGLDNNDQLRGNAFEGALRSTLESLQEFRVTTNSGNSDEGRSSGAEVSLVTKSGTNSFMEAFMSTTVIALEKRTPGSTKLRRFKQAKRTGLRN